ncbi:Bug family tripartite tricarboxylate transporter substrate binding protein [Desulfospira joergensenii]|uniref:Bug family tripartite tricarboxylate transporter substrate binding protein n=1 Tax=Desulfospira joergensenii TaxID=53329 RepID=UPI0003B734D5|nr:tripartite tricarboxylate transporter substrate binding protein [Desulfospira joergensenii]
MKKIYFALFALFLVSFTGFQAIAADFPSKDIQGIIMWGAGGGTDNATRAITPLAEPYLGKQVVLINKPGGTGAISTQYVYSRPSDGYTLLYGAENPQLYGILKLSKLDYKDFYPVNVLARGLVVIVANNKTPWNSFKELVDDAAKNPGKIKMGSTGPGGLPFTVSAMLRSATGFDVRTVPFDGDGPGITATLGGHVDFFPVALGAAREHIRAGRLKALALVSDTKVAGLEDIPLIVDDFPVFKKYLPWGPFYGVWCKRDVPEAAKAKLVEAFKKGADDPKFKQFIENISAVTMNIHGEEADKFLTHWQSVTTWLLHEANATKVSPEDLGIPKP